MFDRALLRLIRADAQKGMSALMEQYTGLVYTIVKKQNIDCLLLGGY